MPRILIGVTGSVAAIKIPELVHKLQSSPFNVLVISLLYLL
jgi:phosphopantothenoylcysteine synthetase/decarboxylase